MAGGLWRWSNTMCQALYLKTVYITSCNVKNNHWKEHFKPPPVVLTSFHQTYNQTFNLILSKVLMLYTVIEVMKVTCLDQITKQGSVCGGAKSEASHRC